jgi:hypothetical protein
MEVIDNINNVYVIKRNLAILKRLDPEGHFEYSVGNFILKIFTHRVGSQPIDNKNDRVTFYDKVDVNLYEKINGLANYIKVFSDTRFSSCPAIHFEGSNFYDLNGLPLINLCELIKFLCKISNLSAFL